MSDAIENFLAVWDAGEKAGGEHDLAVGPGVNSLAFEWDEPDDE